MVIGKQEGAPKQTYRGYGQQFRDNGSKYLHVAAPTYPTSRDVAGSVCELTTAKRIGVLWNPTTPSHVPAAGTASFKISSSLTARSPNPPTCLWSRRPNIS
jgi:hypothetical protein